MAYSRLTNTAIGTSSDYYLRLYWEETVDTVANTSTVNVRLYGYTDRGKSVCSFNQYGTNSITITIDGTANTLSSQNIDTRDWSGSEKLLHSSSKTITHNNDGTKSIAISGSIVYQGGGSSLVAGTYTTSVSSQALTNIARASTVGTVSNVNITSTSGNVTINISKKNSAYYDRVVTTGAISKTLNVGQGTSTTISWSDLLAAMSSTTSATLNITVSTYSNSGYTTLIGSNTGSATITINTSNIKPTISWGAVSVNAGGVGGKFVAGKSTAKATWTVSNASGASVSSVTISGSGCSISSGASSTSTSGTPVTAVLPSSGSNYTFTMTATVRDSRGATATATTSATTVYGYGPPTVSLTAYRVASSGSSTYNPTGTYVYTSFSATTNYTVGGSNSASVTAKNPTNITSGGTFSLAAGSTIAVTVTATDTVGTTATTTVNIGTTLVPVDLYSNAEGTSVGVGFGRQAYPGTVISALQVETSDGASIWAGQNADNFENQIGARSSGGRVYLFSATDGRRGIYLPAAGSVSAKYLIYVDTTGQVHLGDGVPVYTSGDQTVNGTKFFTYNPFIRASGNYPELNFQGRSATTTGRNGTLTMYVQENTARFYFNQFHISGGVQNTYVDTFNLPDTGTDNASHSYQILTSKSAVTVAQGGTGATSAADARANLGVNQLANLSSVSIAGNATATLSITTANYKYYLFRFVCNNFVTTIFSAYSLLSTAANSYLIADGTSSGAEVLITRTASGFTIKRNGSTSCSVILAYWN